MNKSEISQEIFRLERSITDAEKRKADAEKNIRQLNVLNSCCNDYQTEFEFARTGRKTKLEGFHKISGQARLVGAYGEALGELLNGTRYVSAYDSVDTAKSEISQEIERQRQIINQCNNQIASFNSSINGCRMALLSMNTEVKNV